MVLGGSTSATGAASLLARFANTPLPRAERGSFCRLPGFAEAAHPFLAALLHRKPERETVVLVVDGLKAQESALQDLQTWLGDSSDHRQILAFPDWEILPHEPKLPHLDVISERLATLIRLADASPTRPAPLVVASATSLVQRTFSPQDLRSRLRRLNLGATSDPLDLVEWLEDQGYEPEAQVTQKGTLSLRGGIVDVWPPSAAWPVRVEFFGDEVDSIREFDPLTQLTRDRLDEVTLGPAGELGLLRRAASHASNPGASAPPFGTLLDHLPAGTHFLLSEPDRLDDRASAYASQVPAGDPYHVSWDEFRKTSLARGDAWTGCSGEDPTSEPQSPDTPSPPRDHVAIAPPIVSLEVFRPLDQRAPEPAVAEAQRREFLQQLHRWTRQGLEVHLFCNNDGERQRFAEIWKEHGFGELAANPSPPGSPENAAGIHTHLGAMSRGFLCEAAGLAIVTDAEVFGRYKVLRPRRLKAAQGQVTRSLLDIDFTEFEEGDLVVHLEHGIGRFVGLQMAPATPGHRGAVTGPGTECLAIEYAASTPGAPAPRLYVPVSEAHLVSKYVGAGKVRPPLNTLGGTRWSKAKKDAERAVADLAAELLEIQAARETEPGHSFPADSPWQREFEAAFVYEETPDQWRAIEATKQDMERPRPMDRLICGDVGFGKTEVAIRAAFKAVMGGKQVAILVPTTVLAQQHHSTFTERMSDYPVQVELLSRFRSRREQNATLEKLAVGTVDIVIGTHRLLQKDVRFKDLGLVVIDEEQRFGVMHKERFKLLRRTVDVLTLSATPSPRTLYLALSGARDMSTIETPPQDRLPVETVAIAYDERIIRDAIQRELNRQGQVFFLHNRVSTIDAVATKLKALVPDARIVVGHGQMDPDDLEEVMSRFVSGEADILLSTTIVESGLDIPNANTIIIDRADRFGLSELYQLRGRVGRYKHQAYAYLVIPRHAQLLGEARKRIAAIRQYSSLGSGFKIAMRDLEIRGAGNLLGPQQSGHITAVGFDLYCQLLKQSIGALKGEKVRPRVEVQVRLDFLALHPADEGLADRSVPRSEGSRSAPSQEPAPRPNRAVAGLPIPYVPDPKQRVEIHRRIAQITLPGELRDLKAQLLDRFGPIPPPLELLLQVAELRLVAAAVDVTAIESRDEKLMLTRNGQLVQLGGRFPRLTKKEAKARLSEIRRFLGSLAPLVATPLPRSKT
ncbi:MAG: transcription-repair coupling factor [Verrucomicrobiales bacterium]|nr:transcription-repair coupling factor [Verrucomicrobiales bacterium]